MGLGLDGRRHPLTLSPNPLTVHTLVGDAFPDGETFNTALMSLALGMADTELQQGPGVGECLSRCHALVRRTPSGATKEITWGSLTHSIHRGENTGLNSPCDAYQCQRPSQWLPKRAPLPHQCPILSEPTRQIRYDAIRQPVTLGIPARLDHTRKGTAEQGSMTALGSCRTIQGQEPLSP